MTEKTKFLEIELPILNEKIELIANSYEELAGKTVKIDLTRRLRGKSLEIVFKLNFENGKLSINPARLSLLGYFIRRMMRKSIDYVEDSFSAECLDTKLRVKPFLITRKKVSRSIRKALRNKCREEIEKEIKDKKISDIFSDIISGKFQKSLSLKLKKIYPLALCEIREIYAEQKISEKKAEKEIEVKEEKIK